MRVCGGTGLDPINGGGSGSGDGTHNVLRGDAILVSSCVSAWKYVWASGAARGFGDSVGSSVGREGFVGASVRTLMTLRASIVWLGPQRIRCIMWRGIWCAIAFVGNGEKHMAEKLERILLDHANRPSTGLHMLPSKPFF